MKRLYISDNIKAYRRFRGMTQKEFSDHLGVTFQAISKWERELAFPDLFMLPQIAELMGVSIDDLMNSRCKFGEEQMRKDDGI